MFRTGRLAAVATVALLAVGALTPGIAVSAKAQMTIAIEQNGAPVPVTKNEVVLRKAPFAIVTTLVGTQGVSMSASAGAELAKLAEKRKLEEPFTNEFKAMPLEPRNAGEVLLLADEPSESYAYYFYDKPEEHSFNEATASGSQLTGKLKFSNVNVSGKTVPLASFTGSDLYLVFATTDKGRGGRLKISDSDYVHIRFEP